MGGLGAQRGEAADRLRGPALGARLEQPAEQDQRDDRRDRLVVHVGGKAGAREHARDGRRDDRVQECGARAQTDQRVHVGGAVFEPAPGPLVELLARPEHDREGEQAEPHLHPVEGDRVPLARHPVAQREREGHQQPPQQVVLLEGAVRARRPVGHEEHRAEHRDDGDGRGEGEFSGERADLCAPRDTLPLERVLGGDRCRDREARRHDGPRQVVGARRARDVVDRDRLGGLVRRRPDDARHTSQRPLERLDAGRVVQVDDAERDARFAAVVAGLAHRPDQLADAGLGVVVLDRRLGGREVHRRGGDTARGRERLLHRGGAAGAAHPLDRQEDPDLTHRP